MDLYKIIPQNDRWCVSKNIIYINHLAKIPILVKSGDDIWVYFDVKIAKYVIQLVKILDEKNIKFLFKSTSIFFDHKFSEDDIHTLNLTQYIHNIVNEKFFDGFYKIEFDFTNNLSNYLLKYECYDIFKSVYEKQKKVIIGKDWDYWTNKQYYNVKREDIRNYISSLEREIKINFLF